MPRIGFEKSVLAGAAFAVMFATGAQAVDWNVQGFIRQEPAIKLTNKENPYNQQGNIFNGVTVTQDSTALGVLVPPTAVTSTTRTIDRADNTFNLMATRLEVDFQANFNANWNGFARLRGYYQPDIFDGYGDPEFFETDLWSGGRGSFLETNGRNHMVDLPALYLDYSEGPLWLRFGNQQIAWGESLFFRVLDVLNGLDLRRHFILDVVAEEFADTRVSAPGVRGSYRVTNDIEVEAFTQLFNPSILANPDTPYNVIPSQFTIHQRQGFDDAKWAMNIGGRVQAQLGGVAVQAIAVNRRNPDGVFQWTEATGPGALAGTPFSMSNTGVYSAQEWFTYAGMARLNGFTGFNTAIREFQPATGGLGAIEVPTQELAAAELDYFFQLLGPLRGHIARVYPRENILGLGANYVVNADPGSFFDQLVIRSEFTWTPDKHFTSPDLSRSHIVEDEYVASLVLEKYHRFSQDFPATFMVLQYLHKSESDMFGRHLSGMGATGERDSGLPTGESSFNAVAFAAQQPFPNLIWRADMAVLYDLKGGALIQPGLRWKPNEAWTAEVFANITLSDGGNDDIIDTIRWADELAFRITYQF
ncbi:MAG: hypothetical protein C0454_00505 [Parvibaculum sp.]|nr:hypothetical protein [Parvibaculum sp.]